MKTNQSILRFAIPSPLRRQFDYLAPPDLSIENCTVGTRFTLPFGRQKLTGILLSINDSSSVPLEKLRPALRPLDKEALLPGSLFQMCLWASQYYQHPIGDVFSNAIPVLLRQGQPAILDREVHYRLTTKGELIDIEDIKRAPRQAKALAILREHPKGLSQKALSSLSVTTTHLKGLIHKALVIQETAKHQRSWPLGESPLAEPALSLNEEQRIAVDTLNNNRSEFSATLLHGITGSGKTEVYLQLIEKVLSEDKQVLVLVPEIGLTPQTIHRFESRFRCAISVLHSGLTNNQRLQSWLKARSGETHIIIGTRSAIFTPMIRPGLIIIDEEHDTSLKQQEGFRYSARDLAIYRGKKENIPVILGTATPSLETLHNANLQRYKYLPLTKRAGGAKPPRFHLLDIRTRKLNNGLSSELIEKIEKTLNRGEQVLLFLNRRGFAPTMICHDCGWIAQCPRCDARYTIHKMPPHLHCHHCGNERTISESCPSCGSRDLRPIGQGTEKLEDTVRDLFPNVPVQRIDRDSTSRKNAMAEIIEQVHQGKPMILLGTQMIAKGHHFPNVTLVAIVDADGGLFSCDFRAPERMAQLIIQVAGRAGRENKSGEVILQTRQPEHPLLVRLLQESYRSFAEAELIQREGALLPPFSYLALIRAEAASIDRCYEFLSMVRDMLTNRCDSNSLKLLGPVPAPMTRRAGRFRAQLLLQASHRGILNQVLAPFLIELESMKEARKVRWSVDIDPVDLN